MYTFVYPLIVLFLNLIVKFQKFATDETVQIIYLPGGQRNVTSHIKLLYLINVQDLRLPYVVSIDFWQYKVEVEV